jgi:hypothetical protein
MANRDRDRARVSNWRLKYFPKNQKVLTRFIGLIKTAAQPRIPPMKKKSTSQPVRGSLGEGGSAPPRPPAREHLRSSHGEGGFSNLRGLIGLFVCVAGVLIAFFAFGVETTAPASNDALFQNPMTREELAGLYGPLAVAAFTPPACVAGSEMFADVPASNPFCPWIEELARRGITSGCAPNLYCPGVPVTRQQMAVFLIKSVEAAKTVQTVLNNSQFVGANADFSLFSPACPGGTRAASGGWRATVVGAPVRMGASRPSNGTLLDISGVNVADRWLVQGTNSADPQNYHVYVVCVPISGN